MAKSTIFGKYLEIFWEGGTFKPLEGELFVMPGKNGFQLPEKARGSDFVSILKSAHELDNRKRKREIQAVVEFRAAAFVETYISINSKFFNSTSLTRLPSSRSITEDIVDIIGTVKDDKEKTMLSKKYFEKLVALSGFSDSGKKIVGDLLKALDEDLKAIRTLKQAFYYRNKSINAVFSYIEKDDDNHLNRIKIENDASYVSWLLDLETRFLENAKGERFTKNSYFAEWKSFVVETWPHYKDTYDYDFAKSLDFRIEKNLQNDNQQSVVGLENVPNAHLIERFIAKSGLPGTNKAPDFEYQGNILEFKAVKGEGLYAIYIPVNPDLNSLSQVASKILAESFLNEEMGDVSTEIRRNPQLSLVIKSSGGISAKSIQAFESFIRQHL